jgi:hypothetical protein
MPQLVSIETSGMINAKSPGWSAFPADAHTALRFAFMEG